MTTKTTKRKLPKSDLKIAKEKLAELNATPLSKYKVSPEIEKYYSEAWEKRFTELEQELYRRTDSRTMDMIVNADIEPRISIGADHYRVFNPDSAQVTVPKGTLQELSEEVNHQAFRIKQYATELKLRFSDKLGNLPIPDTENNKKETAPSFIGSIEAELLAAKRELSEINSLLTQINDLQEVKL